MNACLRTGVLAEREQLFELIDDDQSSARSRMRATVSAPGVSRMRARNAGDLARLAPPR